MTGLPDPDPRNGPGVDPAIARLAFEIGDASPAVPSPDMFAVSLGRAAAGGGGGSAADEEGEASEEAEAEAEADTEGEGMEVADGEDADALSDASLSCVVLPASAGAILSSKKPGVGRVGGISAGGHARMARLSRRILKEHCSDALTVMMAPALINCPQ